MRMEDIEKAAHEYWKRGQLLLEKPSDTEEAFKQGILWIKNKAESINIDVLIKRKFHGYSEEQWEEFKNKYPYNEIPYIFKMFKEELFK